MGRRDKWLHEASKVLVLPKHRNKNDYNLTNADLKKINEKITTAYAQLYLDSPQLFKWAGMAAWASAEVGGAMDLSTSIWSKFADPTEIIAQSTWISSPELFQLLAVGNLSVFMDLYWQHLAYKYGGLEELSLLHKEGEIPDRVFDAWRLIDEGKLTGDSELIWAGNKALLKYEQETVLQNNVYNADRSLWEKTSKQVDSPMPNHSVSFHDAVPGGDFGNFEDRWKYISSSLLPAFQKWNTKYFEENGLIEASEIQIDQMHSEDDAVCYPQNNHKQSNTSVEQELEGGGVIQNTGDNLGKETERESAPDDELDYLSSAGDDEQASILEYGDVVVDESDIICEDSTEGAEDDLAEYEDDTQVGDVE